MWRNGRRTRLKILRGRPRVGSSPTIRIRKMGSDENLNPFLLFKNNKIYDNSHLLVGKPFFSDQLDFSKFEYYVDCYNNLIP